MDMFIVTVRMLQKNPEHDPRGKKTGPCPVSGHCTDVTGEHHSFLLEADDEEAARDLTGKYGKTHGYRLTRLGEVR
jgi:hypothetical protein